MSALFLDALPNNNVAPPTAYQNAALSQLIDSSELGLFAGTNDARFDNSNATITNLPPLPNYTEPLSQAPPTSANSALTQYVVRGNQPNDQTDYLIEITPFNNYQGTSADGLLQENQVSLQLPIDLVGNDERVGGQAVGGASLLSMLIPAITNPATINGLVSAGQVGMQGIAALREGKALTSANDPGNLTPYTPVGPKANEGENGEREKGKFKRFLSCQESGQGLCCVMPDYCHPWATCISDTDTLGANGGVSLVTDILGAVPRCQCRPGFLGDGKNQGTGCTNADECSRGESGCQHKCTDLTPGYACSCHEGFVLGNDQMSCVDIDECAQGLHACEHQCVNFAGGYSCECDRGYLLREDGTGCEEIDECRLMRELDALPTEGRSGVPSELYELYPSCNVIQLCQNNAGGYICGCPSGFKIAHDGITCVDIDECTEVENTCPAATSMCVNHYGYYECLCTDGYEPLLPLDNEMVPSTLEEVTGWDTLHSQLLSMYRQPGYCMDVNECALELTCATVGGPFAATCVNHAGGYECHCITDANGMEFTDDFLSRDGKNEIQRFHRSLDVIYEYNPIRQICEVRNPCLQANYCGDHATCVYQIGATCQCDDGYEMTLVNDVYICVDIDECSVDEPPLPGQLVWVSGSVEPSVSKVPGGCLGNCINTSGSYECECPYGYETTELGHCEDIDECELGYCNGGCLNFEGGYQCLCPPGYTSRSARTIGVSSFQRQTILDEELNWISSRVDTVPISDDVKMNLWLEAVADLLCRPIENICNHVFASGASVESLICDKDQRCIVREVSTVANFTSLSDFEAPINCECSAGYEASISRANYPDEIRDYIGLRYVGHGFNGSGSYETTCIDINECEVSRSALQWNEPLPYTCKKNKPCCVNTQGSYTCEARKRGDCVVGIYLGN